MPNGAAALAVDPAAVPIEATAGKANTALARSEIEQRIGELTADAALMVCAGISDWECDGRLAPATGRRAGDLVVKLFWLQESTLGQLDFNDTARREGRRVLQERHGAMLAAHYGVPATALDPVLDTIVSWPLDVLTHVTKIERALAN